MEYLYFKKLIPMAAGPKAWVCGRSLAGIAGSNTAGSMNVSFECSVLSNSQVEIFASG